MVSTDEPLASEQQRPNNTLGETVHECNPRMGIWAETDARQAIWDPVLDQAMAAEEYLTLEAWTGRICPRRPGSVL
ncbi:MAG: hypothetical protein M1833_003520 [Piccolia ochrophora]|nr:MAG: hypothetical protein M1833_003520 [Piccolia ochrophora]